MKNFNEYFNDKLNEKQTDNNLINKLNEDEIPELASYYIKQRKIEKELDIKKISVVYIEREYMEQFLKIETTNNEIYFTKIIS